MILFLIKLLVFKLKLTISSVSMSAPVLAVCLDSAPCDPNSVLDWCQAHALLEPLKKKSHHKKPEAALLNQTPLIDVAFWDKKSVNEPALFQCRNECENQVSRAGAENLPTLPQWGIEERPDNDGSTESSESTEQIPLLNERPNHPRWNPKGSTIVRINGRDIDLAALPECSCRPFFVKLRQLEIRHKRNAHEVNQEKVEEARRIWIEKEDACLFCRDRCWSGFSRMREIALERHFQAQLPPELRLKRGRRRSLLKD